MLPGNTIMQILSCLSCYVLIQGNAHFGMQLRPDPVMWAYVIFPDHKSLTCHYTSNHSWPLDSQETNRFNCEITCGSFSSTVKAYFFLGEEDVGL